MREARNAWDWTRAGGNEWIVRRHINPEDQRREVLAFADALDRILASIEPEPGEGRGIEAIGRNLVHYAQVKICIRQAANLLALIDPFPLGPDPGARHLADPISRIIGRTVNKGQNPNDGSGEALLPVLHELVAAVRARYDAHA